MKNIPSTILEARAGIASGALDPSELHATIAEQAVEKNKTLHAYLEVFNDTPTIVAGGALSAIPLAIKDNVLIKGKHASAASKMLEPHVAVYDATVIKKLRDAGALFVGRTNMDEFAMGSSTENSAFGVTKNPLDISRVPGGSSGGSAAAVAMGGAIAAIGSDTGGSIRQPAAFCGLVGLKPTYGAVSRYGLIAMASSLDQIGPITRTVEDAQIIFDVIKGHDPKDATSRSVPRETSGSAPKIIGVPRLLLSTEGIDEDVKVEFEKTVSALAELGYTVVDVDLPHAHLALPVYYIIMPAEVSSNLARFDGVRYGLRVEGDTLRGDYIATRSQGFGTETIKRIMLGTYVLSAGYYDAYYGTALAVRDVITDEFSKAFDAVDAIVTPTTPTPAFKIGEKVNNPLAMYFSDVLTVPANITGIPAISVPSGSVSRDGTDLPVGFQIMAPHFREDTLFTLGKDVEKITIRNS